jgi:hypothetical protein
MKQLIFSLCLIFVGLTLNAQHYFTVKQLETIASHSTKDGIYKIQDFVSNYGYASSKLYSDINTFFDQYGTKLKTYQLDDKKKGGKIFTVVLQVPLSKTSIIHSYKNYINNNYKKVASTYVQDGRYIAAYKEIPDKSLFEVTIYNNTKLAFDVVAKKISSRTYEISPFTSKLGVKFLKGDRVTLLASGSMSLGAFAGNSSPNGISGFEIYNYNKNFPHGALLGRFGKTGNWFLIGKSKTITVNQDASLYVRINDIDLANNSGKYTLSYAVNSGNSNTNNVVNTSNTSTNNNTSTSSCLSGDCNNGYGTKKYNNGTYIGFFKNGLRHGKGAYKFTSGNSYDGDWVNNKKEGNGKFIWIAGESYDGKWKNDLRHGYGTYIFKTGNMYAGYWKENKKDGYGTFAYANGEKYVGNYKADNRHGQGKAYNAQGTLTYDGQWSNGKKVTSATTSSGSKGCTAGNCNDGFGTYYYNNGYYKGFFKNGQKHGYGYYSWNKGDFYFGNWSNDVREGFGQYFWKDKSNYLGEWKNGTIAGYGSKKSVDGKYSRGIWQNGKLIAPYNYYKNTATTGCTTGDCKDGYGKYVYKNGDYYIGFFVNGKRYAGTYYYSNGNLYQGQFGTDESFNGYGYFLWKNKNHYSGQFVKNKKQGRGYYKNETNNSIKVGEWNNDVLSKSYQ